MEHHPKEKELHVRDYLRVLYRRRWPALAVFVVTVAVAVIRAYLQTPVYRAATRILIEKTEMHNLAMINPIYASWDPDFHRTQVQIIRSTATAERTARLLMADEEFRSRYRGGETPGATAPGAAAEDAPPPRGLVRMIQGGITATPEKDSKIIVLTFTASDPEVAARVVNTAVRAYIEQLFEMKMSYSRYAVSWMTDKAREEAAKLDQAERALQRFMKDNDLVTMENRVAVIPERLSELGLELTRAETRRRELAAVAERLEDADVDPAAVEPLPVIQGDAAYRAVAGQLLRAEQNVLDLSRKYLEKHPAMVAARREVAALQDKKAAEVRRIATSLRAEYELALAREEDLRRRLASGRGEAIAAGEKFVRYEELRRVVETNRQFYDTLMTRAKEESLTQQLQGVQVWTLEPAEVPAAPYGPRTTRTILLGLLVGLAGSVGMAFFVEYLDNTVRSAEDLEAKTGLPVLGVIPRVRGEGRSIEEAVLKEPRQQAAEAVRTVRTGVLLASDRGPPKAVLVTSTAPEEGKTSIAVNLAVATAQSGYSVLLLDADLRKPRIARVFGVSSDRGLSDVLAGDDAEPALVDVGVKNLTLLPSGPLPPNPSELLGSKGMDVLLRDLRERFDILIVDAPPLLTVTDALVLARKLEAVILISRAERSTYDRVRRGIKALGDLGIQPLGVVLNGYDERRDGTYYYYHYYYGDEEKGRRRRAGREEAVVPERPSAGSGEA